MIQVNKHEEFRVAGSAAEELPVRNPRGFDSSLPSCADVHVRGMTRYWSTYQTTSGLFSLLLFSLLLTTPTWCIVSYSLLQVYSVYMGTHMYMCVCVHVHVPHVYYMYSS